MRANKAALLRNVAPLWIKSESRRAGDERSFRDFTAPLEHVLRLRAVQHCQWHFLSFLLLRGEARSDDLVALRTANMPGFQRAGLYLVLAENVNPFRRGLRHFAVLLPNGLALADINAAVLVGVCPTQVTAAHSAGVGVA